jgi:hypothetical protein
VNTQILVHKERTNSVLVDLGLDITGNTITSEIRSEPFSSSALIATWTATVTNAALGLLTLTLDNSITSAITASGGFMDIKRVVSGEPIPVFNQPLEVVFIGSVTA